MQNTINELEQAEYWHKEAQRTGKPEDYKTAAYWYDLAGRYTKAEKCREAAERLQVNA